VNRDGFDRVTRRDSSGAAKPAPWVSLPMARLITSALARNLRSSNILDSVEDSDDSFKRSGSEAVSA